MVQYGRNVYELGSLQVVLFGSFLRILTRCTAGSDSVRPPRCAWWHTRGTRHGRRLATLATGLWSPMLRTLEPTPAQRSPGSCRPTWPVVLAACRLSCMASGAVRPKNHVENPLVVEIRGQGSPSTSHAFRALSGALGFRPRRANTVVSVRFS